MDSLSQSEGLEALRARIEEAKSTAGAGLRDVPFEELESRVASHELGVNVNGWKNPYPKDDPRSLYLEYQFAYHHDRSRFKAALWSRQTGKDFTGEGEAVEDCLRTPKTEWMVAAPSERQSHDSLDKAKEWAAAYDLAIANYEEQREGSSSETLLKSAEITFANGARISAVPGKPDTVRGRSTNVFLTEFDFFENPNDTWRAILPSITNPLRGGEKKIRVVTTPNGAGSAMDRRIWNRPAGELMSWSKHFVTIYHAVLMGLPVDAAALIEAMDDPEGVAQELFCRFLDGSNVLLPYDVIQLAESFDASETWDLANGRMTGQTYLGVDFGRTTDPTVCWTLQRVGDILWTREVLVLKAISSPDQEQILRDRIASANRVCFDYTGPGIGLGDYLARAHGEWDPAKHRFGKVELCTFTTGFKRELFPKLRRTFEAPTKLRIPVSTTIREDLHEMQQVITNGEYNYWSPRTKNGHSDRCTALALAVRAVGDGAVASTSRGVSIGASDRAITRRNTEGGRRIAGMV
jgi:phage FluMu gp28-like protein